MSLISVEKNSLENYLDENEKEFDKIVIINNVDANLLQRGLSIVEKFIVDRNLILYGGLAIDFALRLHGTCLYPDDAVPDYDMYSSDSVKDCYDLTDIMFANGMTTSRSVPALYVRAMKNSVSSNRSWIADLSYVPIDIYTRLPTLVYNGMRFIHPHYQMIDTHQSLSAPFQNPAIGEPVFVRFKKDIERYNLLVKYYPLPNIVLKNTDVKPTTITLRYMSEVLIMFPAYGAMLRKFNEFSKDARTKFPELVLPDLFQLRFQCGSNYTLKNNVINTPVNGSSIINNDALNNFKLNMTTLTCESFNGEYSIIHCNVHDFLNSMIELSSLHPNHFEPFLNIIPKRTVFNYRDYKFTIYNTSGYLIGYSEFNIDGLQIKVASVQYQLKLLLAYYLFDPDDNMKHIYLSCYNSLCRIINFTEQFFKLVEALNTNDKNPAILPTQTIVSLGQTDSDIIHTNKIIPNINISKSTFDSAVLNHPFMLPVKPYGYQNCNTFSEREELSFNMIDMNLGISDSIGIPMPKNYNAGTNRPPSFDYHASKYFRISGKQISGKHIGGDHNDKQSTNIPNHDNNSYDDNDNIDKSDNDKL